MKPTSCAIFLAPLLAAAVTVAASAPSAWASECKVLHSFGSGMDGSLPYGPLVFGAQGNFYGVTINGGTGTCSDYGCGTIFQLSLAASGKWTERVLYSFTGGNDGGGPYGGLVLDDLGKLYGTTEGGPATNSEIFELTPAPGGWDFALLYDNGAGPGLLLDSAGNLYGDIGPGDYFEAGAVGELSPGANGWTYAQLYSFCSQNDCADGLFPEAPFIWDGHGNLYGTTYSGGLGQQVCLYGCGVVFKMAHKPDGSWRYQVLHRFDASGHDGRAPSGLVMDAAGNLYGITVAGGARDLGTIFEMSKVGGRWTKTVLYDFPDCANGCAPFGTLAFDSAGSLYGAGAGGKRDCGGYTCGVIFKMTPQANGGWNGRDGDSPWGVVVDANGNIFGTTSSGGKYNQGVAFEITP